MDGNVRANDSRPAQHKAAVQAPIPPLRCCGPHPKPHSNWANCIHPWMSQPIPLFTHPTPCLPAVPHSRTVDCKTLLLIDSGGQYECGTTDITRTFHFGTPSEHQKRCYTRVLQGHIKLSQVWVVSETCHCSEGTVVCRAGVSDT
jgi:hypothetical protein